MGKRGKLNKMEREVKDLTMKAAWAHAYFRMIDKKSDAEIKDRYALAFCSKDIPQEVKAEIRRAKYAKFEDMTDEEIVALVRNDG